MHLARLLLRQNAEPSRPVPPQLHLLHQLLLLVVRDVPEEPRRPLRNGRLRLLRVPRGQHRHGQRRLRLREVHRAQPDHPVAGFLLVLHLLPHCPGQRGVNQLHGTGGHALLRAGLLQFLLPQLEHGDEGGLCARAVPQGQCELLFPPAVGGSQEAGSGGVAE